MGDRNLTNKQVDPSQENESEQATTTEARYAEIVHVLGDYPDVTFGSAEKKGFGSSALKVKGKIFAMIDSKGNFVVKLPKKRVDALVSAGKGEHFDPGHGRLMKEWLETSPDEEWLPL